MTMYGEPVTQAVAEHRVVPELALAVRDLRRSAEPAVVLSSLARSCVPSFSDSCAVELSEGLDQVFHVSYPLPGEDSASGGNASLDDEPRAEGAADKVVTTSFEMPSAFGRPSFAGHVIHSWKLRIPAASDAIIARLLVDEALTVVRYQRLAEVAAEAETRSAQLALEAMTGRTIGEATGIVMATRHLAKTAAVDLLKVASRQSGRSLHNVALEVVHAGAVAHGPNEPTASLQRDTARARNLRSVP
jgi:hypothetical protein